MITNLSGMSLRLVAAGAVAATAALLLTPASASPFVGEYRYLASYPLDVVGADGGHWALNLEATLAGSSFTRPEERLYVDLSRCVGDTCTFVARWSKPLSAAEVEIDSKTTKGTLKTTLAGVPFTVSLTAQPTLTPVDGYGFNSLGINTGQPGVRPGLDRSRTAAGSVVLGRLSCALKRSVLGTTDEIDSTGDDTRFPDAPTTLPAGFVTGKSKPHC